MPDTICGVSSGAIIGTMLAQGLVRDGCAGARAEIRTWACPPAIIRTSPLHWRQNRGFSDNNIMALGIWYEQMAPWAGHAASAFAVGQAVVKHRGDEAGARVPITIPDHVDVSGQLQQGGQYRLLLSSVLAR